jgi:hypothetical protein
LFLATVVAFTVSGCAEYKWQKIGSTQADFNRDSYECEMEAARTYPTALVTQQLAAGYTTPSTTNCYGSGSATGFGGTVYGNNTVNCTTTPGQVVRPVTYTADANADNRQQAAKACMYAHGYQLLRVK